MHADSKMQHVHALSVSTPLGSQAAGLPDQMPYLDGTIISSASQHPLPLSILAYTPLQAVDITLAMCSSNSTDRCNPQTLSLVIGDLPDDDPSVCSS